MVHPFAKIFSNALKVSDEFTNVVLEKAEELENKGYAGREIAQVLQKYVKGLIDPKEELIVQEAFEEFAHYLDD